MINDDGYMDASLERGAIEYMNKIIARYFLELQGCGSRHFLDPDSDVAIGSDSGQIQPVGFLKG